MEELAPAAIPLQTKKDSSTFAQNIEKMVKGIHGYEVIPLSASEDMEDFMLKRPKILPPMGIGVSSEVLENETFVKTFFNGNARRGPAIALSAISNARIGGATDAITTSLHVYRAESVAKDGVSNFAAVVDDVLAKVMIVVLIVLFGMLVSGFIMQLVDEKRTNFKHQQLLTGLSSAMYWLSVVIFDFLFYFITCCVIMIVFWTANFPISSPIAVIFFVYFWASMPLVCCASFLFTSPVKAYVLMILYTLVLPTFSVPITILLGYFHPRIHDILEPIFMLVEPNYVLQSAVLNVLIGSTSYAWEGLGKQLFMLFMSGLFFWFLLFALQTRLISSLIVKLKSARRVTADTMTEDEDVTDERRRMDSISEDELAISVRNLNKYYGPLHAVKNLTFGVRTDECFGLLGANGAGKTTTFDVLTGVSLSDGGVATINGELVSRIRALGFCPQFDALLEDLTARETLKIMVTLRGYTDVQERIQNVLEAIALEDRANKLVSKYSGGQRRRLSVGLALISQARVILLDEPTAGIDPKTRRQIWDLLSAMRDESCAMLLTSHSMEECEALCTRIGILLRGALTAIGPPQRIKSRFGEGYSITFTLKREDLRDRVIEAMSTTFPQAVLKTTHPSIHLTYHLKRSENDRWSRLFDAVHRFKTSRLEIADYSLAQTTLEEAFLRLSQMDEEGAAARAHENMSLDVSSLV